MAGELISGVVYEVEYDLVGEEECGTFIGFWTGEIDYWGKLKICTIDRDYPIYLFPEEVISISRIS